MRLDAGGRIADTMQLCRDPGCQGSGKVDYINDEGDIHCWKQTSLSCNCLRLLEIIYPCLFVIITITYILPHCLLEYYLQMAIQSFKINNAQTVFSPATMKKIS